MDGMQQPLIAVQQPGGGMNLGINSAIQMPPQSQFGDAASGMVKDMGEPAAYGDPFMKSGDEALADSDVEPGADGSWLNRRLNHAKQNPLFVFLMVLLGILILYIVLILMNRYVPVNVDMNEGRGVQGLGWEFTPCDSHGCIWCNGKWDGFLGKPADGGTSDNYMESEGYAALNWRWNYIGGRDGLRVQDPETLEFSRPGTCMTWIA